jgi:general secretion pathway protein D
LKHYRQSLSLALCLGLALAGPGWTQTVPPVGDVVVNMRGAEIRDVAEQVSRITGRTLILDPSVAGTVNVVSSEPLAPAGVWDLFLSVLRVHGYAAIRSGASWRIVPQAAVIQSGSGVDLRRARSQEVVTRLIRLQNLSPDQAVRVLRPLVASFGSLEAINAPPAIVVTDYAENVRRIEILAQALDSGSGQAFESLTLRYASAAEVGQSITSLLGAGGEGGGIRVAVDERSNIVLVRGDANDIREARAVAEALDVPGGTAPVTRVVRLNHADAETVTEVLRGLMGASESASNPVARALATGDQDTNVAGLMASRGSAAGQGSGPGSGPVTVASPGPRVASGFSLADITIQPAPELNAVVMRGSPAAIAEMAALIADLDQRRPQVMIEAVIVEVTGDLAEQLGVQLGLGAAAVQTGSAGGTSFSNVGVSLRQILLALGAPGAVALAPEGASAMIRSGDDFSILIQALNSSTRANLLSTPSITTLDNQPAEIIVGQNVPFRTGSFTTQGNSTNPFTTIEREDVGITLRVIPRIHDGDVIRLEVAQEVSSLVNANLAGAADLITNRRSIETTVLADNGQTIVLGGLISDDRLSSNSQVPMLGDIPVLGRAFRSNRESITRKTLFIFLRPTILRDPVDVAANARAQYERLRDQESLPTRGFSLLATPPGPRLPTEIEGIY